MNVAMAGVDPASTGTSHEHAKRLGRFGWWIALGAILPLGAWMSFAPLSMAVVAPGFVKVDLNRRPVQHLEGGIVRAVLVRDGQSVKAGDPILVLGDVGVDADRNRLAYRAQCRTCRAGPARGGTGSRTRAGLSQRARSCGAER